MPDAVRDRVAAALTMTATRSAEGAAGRREATTADAMWQDALEGRLPDEPAALREAAERARRRQRSARCRS